uniref:Uncharacterized protein n=1 Tax=Oryza nivara TaxID=4536 RepID=A0A0E0GT90_ORYNI
MVLQGAGKSIGSWKQQCKLGFLSIVALRGCMCPHCPLWALLRCIIALTVRRGQDRRGATSRVTSSTAPPPPVTTMAETVDFASGDAAEWRAALAAYDRRLAALGKPDLVEVDSFYRRDLPDLLRRRDPEPFLAKPELVRLLQWKLSRGKWRPRLMDFVKGLEDAVVESASCKAFAALPDLRKAITELTVLKGVGPATASAVLAAYAPDVAPFMSDEAMVAALGNAKEYTLKQYLAFAEKLQTKSKELSSGEEVFTTSDVERALWSSAVASKSLKAPPGNDLENKSKTHGKRKR